MSLPSGSYTIRSVAFENPYVGRNISEDRSLLPKRVLSLPSGVRAPVWDIESLEGGRYYLKANGAATSVVRDAVYAVLLPTPPGEEWDLQQLPQYGENQYLIVKNSGDGGWVLPSADPFTQIAARPLIVQPSSPPQYPPNQRWIIERV